MAALLSHIGCVAIPAENCLDIMVRGWEPSVETSNYTGDRLEINGRDRAAFTWRESRPNIPIGIQKGYPERLHVQDADTRAHYGGNTLSRNGTVSEIT